MATRFYCSASSQTVHLSGFFAAYHTHLVYTNRLCSFGWSQMPHITHILLRWTILFSCLIENSLSEWTVCQISHTPWSGWLFLLHSLIAHSSSKGTVFRISHTHWYGYPFLLFFLIANSSAESTVCPASHTQLKSDLCLMHPSSQAFWTFLTVLWHHRLRLLHRTQFLEGAQIVVSR